MNEKEIREFIREVISLPHHCVFCGGLLEDYGKTDTGYSVTRCTKCGYIFNEE